MPATAWVDDGQQRDQLSSNDDDSEDESDSDSDDDAEDDFAGVPYVPIGDGSNASAAPFYPGDYRT